MLVHTITLPKKLDGRNIYLLFNELDKMLQQEKNYKQIIFDMTKLKFIMPDGIVGLAALVKSMHKYNVAQTISAQIDTKSEALQYLTRMDFFNKLGASVEYNSKKIDSSGRFCELIQVNSESEITQASNKILKILDDNFSSAYNNIAVSLGTAIDEILMNVFHHSGTEIPSFVCAQSYRNWQRICIAIVDCGIGYKNHLEHTYGELKSDNAAIQLALKKHITGNQSPGIRSNTGLGLYYTKEIIKKNKGDMYIYTGKGNYELINGIEDYYSVPEWKGTLVSMSFRINNPVKIDEIYEQDSDEDNIGLNDLF